ncbi:hypothetical protein ACHAXT_002411 [Thalassiosira profunda]
MAKRQRLEESAAVAASPAVTASPPPSAEVGLPAELWANVMSFAYFDEVLSCTAVSKFFFTDVARQIKRLWIRSGESMDVAPAVVARFTGVEKVDVYAIMDADPEDRNSRFHVDWVALQSITPFLSRLPKLARCYIGTLDGIVFDANRGIDFGAPDADVRWAGLIQSVCKAYQMSDLSDDVQFEGLIPWCGDICPWKQTPCIESYRDDVPCQICDMICNSLPTREILRLEDSICIEFENVVKIAICRDGKKAVSTMTTAICDAFDGNISYHPVLCPPDYASTKRYAIGAEIPFDKIEYLISNGGNPRDWSVRNKLLSKHEYRHGLDCFLGDKLVITMQSYDELKHYGFDASEDDFLVVDTSEERTSVRRFEGMAIRSQLKSGIPISDIAYIREYVKMYSVWFRAPELTERMQNWFGVDRSEEDISSLINELSPGD